MHVERAGGAPQEFAMMGASARERVINNMASANRGGSAKQTVMVVGDGAGAKELKEKLTGEGYDVVGTASTAASAAKMFTSKQPQVLVLNLSAAQLDTARSMSALMQARRCPMI